MITNKIIETLEPFLLKWHNKIQINDVIRKTAVLIFPFVLIEQIENSCRKIQINGIIIMVIFSIKKLVN